MGGEFAYCCFPQQAPVHAVMRGTVTSINRKVPDRHDKIGCDQAEGSGGGRLPPAAASTAFAVTDPGLSRGDVREG